jgi:hypothetical protein
VFVIYPPRAGNEPAEVLGSLHAVVVCNVPAVWLATESAGSRILTVTTGAVGNVPARWVVNIRRRPGLYPPEAR